MKSNIEPMIEQMVDKKIVTALKDFKDDNNLLKDQLRHHDTLLFKYQERLEQNERKLRLKILIMDGLKLNQRESIKYQVNKCINSVLKMNLGAEDIEHAFFSHD